MSATADQAISALRARLGTAVLSEVAFRGETTFSIPLESLRSTMLYLRDELGFNYLLDISSLDHFGESPRFEMVYELYALPAGIHLRIKTTVPDDDEPVVPTLSDLWATADWHEREVFDMMGIRFADHKDLRRILMWEGYPFHPLRKDFPLQGKPSDLEEVAFSEIAPLAGGPFVTVPTPGTTQIREPRARRAGDEPPDETFAAP